MKDEIFDEKESELYGAIQVLHDYTLMHLRKRNCVENPGIYTLRNELKPFDTIISLKRIKRAITKTEHAIHNLL